MKTYPSFSIAVISAFVMQACSVDSATKDFTPTDPIIGTWESWKQVDKNGNEMQLTDGHCAYFVSTFLPNGTGNLKNFFIWQHACTQFSDEIIEWRNTGSNLYELTSNGLQSLQQYTFVDNNTFFQMNEVNQRKLYFRRKPSSSTEQ